jgi:hypothetical protein
MESTVANTVLPFGEVLGFSIYSRTQPLRMLLAFQEWLPGQTSFLFTFTSDFWILGRSAMSPSPFSKHCCIECVVYFHTGNVLASHSVWLVGTPAGLRWRKMVGICLAHSVCGEASSSSDHLLHLEACWVALPSWLQLSLGSTHTINPICLSTPRGDKGFPMLSLPQYLISCLSLQIIHTSLYSPSMHLFI